MTDLGQTSQRHSTYVTINTTCAKAQQYAFTRRFNNVDFENLKGGGGFGNLKGGGGLVASESRLPPTLLKLFELLCEDIWLSRRIYDGIVEVTEVVQFTNVGNV